MPIETRSNSALFKRAEQLKRWEDSETNKVVSDVPVDKKSKIKFSEGCVFLAACAASDTDEVERLLEQGADINTANVDGLTALHQACIDDNLEMVQFLVEHGCDLNRGDNEGWTPLHATASCGFISIAKYLIEHGANVAAVNNDGDLPIDIAEIPEMEDLLSDVLDEQGIDCDEARSEEERVMLEDAKQWLNSTKFQDKVHPRTGATALHVASAKGYINVMKILIQAGADLNAQDNDGWTPLHAAAHWGQKEACAILADSLANMDIQNLAGQTCFDVAEPDLVKLLEELKKKQASMQKERPEIQAILQRTSSNRPPLKRRTSVTRMSGQEKSKSVIKDTKSERVQIEQLCLPEEDTEEEKEKKTNEGLQRLGVVKPELSAAEERELAMQRKDALLESLPKQKPPAPKEGEPDKIPSWKKFLRRNSGNSEGGIEKPFEEPEIAVKKPKTSDVTEMETSNGPVDEESKDRVTNVEASHPSNPPSDAVSECSSSSPSSPSDTSSESQSQTKRPFIPPIRDEESELQRKAHAKRVRETRRSTQGVLLEDIKTAEMQYLMKAQQEAAKRKEDVKEKQDDDADDDEKEKSPTPPPVMQTRWSPKDESQMKTKEINETPGDKHTEKSATAEVKESTEKAAQEIPSSPDTSTVTIPLRTKTSNSSNNTSDEQNQQDNRSSLGTQAAIQRRRRPKRRSTGVVYLDSDDAQDEKSSDSKENVQSPAPDKSQKEQTVSISEKAKQKYGSSTSLPDTSSEVSSRGETPSRYSSVSSSRSSLIEDSSKDFKKLYEDTKKENERLREKLKKTEDELERVNQQLQKTTQNNNNRNSVSETERKERRALERKVSEMEEEVKTLSKLKTENEKLKAENRALSRVVCKLSK